MARRKRTNTKTGDLDSAAISTLHQSLVEFFIHQDQIFWNSTQLLLAIQAAILTAGYALRGTWLSFLSLVGGAAITVLLFMFLLKVEWDRDANLPLMNELAELLIPPAIKRRHKNRGETPPHVRFWATPPLGLGFIRGRYILRLVIVGLIIVDIVLAILYFPSSPS